jgi:hypothetical protein
MTDASPAESLLRRAVVSLRGRPDALLISADGHERPDLILIDRWAGMYAIEFEPNGNTIEDRAPFVRLNRKRAELRETLGDLASSGVGAVVVLGAAKGRFLGTQTANHTALAIEDLDDPTWPDLLPARPIDEPTFQAIVDRVAPAVVFTRRGREGAADPGAIDREGFRIQLDAAQAATALGPVEDVAVITGPPGSGKTLLLAARARHLAQTHSGWNIAVVMFNRALVPYVAGLVGDPSVTVMTVGKFAHQLGCRIDFEGGVAASRELARARARGIPRVVDAVLVDEVQDMDPAWLHFLLDVVRPGRGGVVLAGDPAQSLYRESDLNDVLRGRSVVHHALVRPYRSTKPILNVARALSPSSPVVGIEWSPDGEPVDLIWASSWSGQAACIAWEIGTMVADGHRKPGDIAVLVTQRRGTLGRLRAALDAEAIPYEVIDHTNVAQFDPAAPTVKLLTVHSGKGHEFPVVVLLGLEALPVGGDAEARQRERVGFVGTTRAKDQLLISYTRQNPYLERLIALGDDIRRWTWPDDYEV